MPTIRKNFRLTFREEHKVYKTLENRLNKSIYLFTYKVIND
jgi:hypothetical protein